jgi:hypothetical protein
LTSKGYVLRGDSLVAIPLPMALRARLVMLATLQDEPLSTTARKLLERAVEQELRDERSSN